MGRMGLGGHLKALIRRPDLLLEAVRAGFAMRRRRRPIPSAAYLRWRVHTAYGSEKAAVRTDDLVHYLRWRREMRRLSERAGVI